MGALKSGTRRKLDTHFTMERDVSKNVPMDRQTDSRTFRRAREREGDLLDLGIQTTIIWVKITKLL